MPIVDFGTPYAKGWHHLYRKSLLRATNNNEPLWIDANGDAWRITDLTDNHLKNIIRYYKTHPSVIGSEWIALINEEFARRKQPVNTPVFSKLEASNKITETVMTASNNGPVYETFSQFMIRKKRERDAVNNT